MTPTKFSLAALLAATTALPAMAQEITPLTDYDPTQIEGAWSADNMRDADVLGEDGDTVGYVQNLVLSSDGSVSHVVIETDNWFDLADRAIAVPWENVDLTPEEEGIMVPMDEDEMNDFTLFADDMTMATEGENYRASDVLDDYVTLDDGTGYGYVTDLIFDQGGALQSVVVSPDVGFGGADGLYAYPYYGTEFGYEPYGYDYNLRYDEGAVTEYQPFDYESVVGDSV